MTRIIYPVFSDGGQRGGHKMAFRHVETLRALGFDAAVYMGATNVAPTWFDHNAPLLIGRGIRSDDVVAIPDDAGDTIAQATTARWRTVVFAQGIFFGAPGLPAYARFPKDRFPSFMAVSGTLASNIRRAFPGADVEVVPCFVDDAIFRPGARKTPAIVYSPRKRPFEAKCIRGFFQHFHAPHAALPWTELMGRSERDVAAALGEATLFLSLSRLESVGLTPLEAMASDCVCAGFTGLGGREYATAENGFWVEEDDALAAADALAEAADLAASGGARLARYLEAGRETVGQWSPARFREALEAFWMRVAPEARRKNGPLDTVA